MTPNIKKLVVSLEKQKIDALLVTNDANIRYLTGFPASESWLLVCKKWSVYITDFRYVLEARRGLTGVTVKQYTKSPVETLFALVGERKVKRLGFDDQHISVALFNRLRKKCPGRISLLARHGLVEGLREIKTAEEVRKIRKALKLNSLAYRYVQKIIKPGLTECDVFLKLENFVKSRGAAFSFDPIIASGPNSCYPHARVTGRKIRLNEPVLVDMGIDWQGYKSDLTRMFFLGKISPLLQDVYDIVEVAQKKAIERVRPGIPAREIDQQARKYFAKHQLDKCFGHSLGHGVGLDIHELPRVSQNSTAILEKGMIFTVEPALYLPNKFGVRIEDMVLVTAKGCEVLSDDID